MEKTTVGLCINKMWQIQKKISSGHFIKHKPLIFLKIWTQWYFSSSSFESDNSNILHKKDAQIIIQNSASSFWCKSSKKISLICSHCKIICHKVVNFLFITCALPSALSNNALIAAKNVFWKRQKTVLYQSDSRF